MFSITMGKGFNVKFENGWSVSVQFGTGNYCDNRTDPFYKAGYTAVQGGLYQSRDAEVAIIKPNGDFYNPGEGDDVIGWQSADDVAEIMAMVAAW